MPPKVKIAINGFGRIGRLALRQLMEVPSVEVAAINDLAPAENLVYLFKHDSVYRDFSGAAELKKGILSVNGRDIKIFQEKDPSRLPWKDLEIDIVIESTGVFESFEKSQNHISAGAKRVVITAPAKDADGEVGKTVLMGVNEGEFGKTLITSNGSCTTNAAAAVVEIMKNTVGVKKAILNTAHAYTASQNLVDGPIKGDDLRRGRAGADNIVPSFTGAAVSVARAVPELSGKFDGIALRVPVICGSAADINFISSRPTSVEEVNDIFRQASQEERWREVLKTSEEPLVSSDIIGDSHAAVVDLSFTRVVDGDLVKVLAWYDNEWGYVKTLVSHVMKVASLL